MPRSLLLLPPLLFLFSALLARPARPAQPPPPTCPCFAVRGECVELVDYGFEREGATYPRCKAVGCRVWGCASSVVGATHVCAVREGGNGKAWEPKWGREEGKDFGCGEVEKKESDVRPLMELVD